MAALRPGGVNLQGTGIAEALGLAGSAAAATPAALVPAKSVSMALRTNLGASTAPVGLVAALPGTPSSVAERGWAVPQNGPVPGQNLTRLEVAKSVPSLGPDQASQAAPPTASAPEAIAVKEPEPNQPAGAPVDKVVAVPTGPSFNETFQAVSPPSLASGPAEEGRRPLRR
ncbi:MAG: hypothetical protein ACKOUT_02610 [Novosphingobium sp.]